MNTQDKDNVGRLRSTVGVSHGLLAAVVASFSTLAAASTQAQPPSSSPGCQSTTEEGPQGSDDDDVAMMSAGDGVRCIVTVGGDAKCWGRNDAGQLGRGDSVQIGDDESPGAADFIDLGGRAREIHTNGEQTFALLDDGVIRAWGANSGFELGLKHTESVGDDETPACASVGVDVCLGASAVQLAVGADFACARLEDGAVRCWGANDFGQLGYGHTQSIGDDETPAHAGAVELGGAAVSVVAGAHHACALLDDGAVRCWGLGQSGQLGLGCTSNIGDDELPANVGAVEVGGPVAEIVAGGYHTCARLESGAVRCWGEGSQGQLGYGNVDDIGDDETPKSVGSVPVGVPVVALAAGLEHTCAVLLGGTVRCWGDGAGGRLGYGNEFDVGDDETPQDVGDVDLGPLRVAELFIGSTASSTCVRLEDGGFRCWGANDVGQLGYGHTGSIGTTAQTVPSHVPDIIMVERDRD
ncbi:MAG: hypothetical protein AAGF11_55180 [Myxococcota bacterium]